MLWSGVFQGFCAGPRIKPVSPQKTQKGGLGVGFGTLMPRWQLAILCWALQELYRVYPHAVEQALPGAVLAPEQKND